MSLFRLLRLRKNNFVNLTLLPEIKAADLRSLGPIHVCICGSKMFKALVMFEDYELSWWSLDGECVDCGSLVVLPCPVDRP